MTIALIDADIIAYKAACVSTQSIDWDGDGAEAPVSFPQRAEEAALHLVEGWCKAAKSNAPILCFSDREPGRRIFRYGIAPDYKGQRKAERPELLDHVVDYLKGRWKSVTFPYLEGDDVIGVLMTGGTLPNSTVAVSIDKDINAVPGRVLLMNKNPRVRLIKPMEADRAWMRQTLMGDTVDHYKGAPGIGEVNAHRIVNIAGVTVREMWGAVLWACHKEVKPAKWKALLRQVPHPPVIEHYMIGQARLARILRAEDYNQETGEIRLWHPQRPEWVHPRDLLDSQRSSDS